MSPWTEEKTDLLRKLWLEGLSAEEIMVHPGINMTRSAVCAKVARLGLARRVPGSNKRVMGKANIKHHPRGGFTGHSVNVYRPGIDPKPKLGGA